MDVLNAVDTAPDLSSVFASLSQGWGRTQGHRLRILSLVTSGETTLDRDLLAIRADRILRVQAHEMFHHLIDTVRDTSECGLARNVVRRDASGRWEFVNDTVNSEWCKKTDVICRQDDELASKEPQLRALAAALTPSHKKMSEACLAAASKPADGKGQACFRHLGDVSIALECDQSEVVLTTDGSFDVMAPVLGIDVERFAPTPPP